MMQPSQVAAHILDVDTWNPGASAPKLEFQYIDLSAVDQDEKRISASRKLLGADAPSRARQLVRAGDVLVSTVRPNLNGVARVPHELDGATASTGFCVLRADELTLAGEYLFHWVKSQSFVDDMVRKATGANYPAVSDRIVHDSMLPLPCIEEQRRIAAILDQAEALRAKRRQTVAKLDTLTQSLFLEMFGDPATNPKAWPIATVQDVVDKAKRDIRCGPFGTQLKVAELTQSGVPLLGIETAVQNVFNPKVKKYISPEKAEYLSAFSVCPGDVLVTRMGTIGRSCVVPNDFPEARFSYHLFRIRPDSSKCLPEFLSSTISKSGIFMKQLRDVAHGAIMDGLSTENLRSVKFALPPIELQRSFLGRLRTLERSRDLMERDSLLTSLTSSLQHRAFRGEL